MIRLSFSAAQKYLLSPFSYFAHYLLKLREEQLSSALVFGAALDDGFNSLLEDLRDGRVVDLDKAKREFLTSFLKQDVNGEEKFLYDPGVVRFSKADLDESLLTEEDLQSTLNKSWLSLSRKGEILIEEYYEQVIPKLEKVILVQHEINMPNAEGDVLIGIVDLVAQIDGKVYLIDNKSTSISYKDDSADNSAQLATYYEALRHDYKLDGVMYITIAKKVYKKKKPRIAIRLIPGQVSEELIEKTFQDYDAVLRGIKTGKFECSRQCMKTPWGCAYSSYCLSQGKNSKGLLIKKDKK